MSEHQGSTLSLEEAAAVLKVGVPTVEELIGQGSLRALREDGEICVPYADLLAYLRDSQRAGTEEGEPPR